MNFYGHKVNQLARSFNKKLNEKISPLGIYTSQWAIILYLYEKKECSQIELGNYLCVEAPTITRTLARMEKMGWIEKVEGIDKREKHILLTKKALDAYLKCFEASDKLEKEAISGISDEELEIFNRVLEKMTNNLEKE